MGFFTFFNGIHMDNHLFEILLKLVVWKEMN